MCERRTVLDGPHRGDVGKALAARAGGIGQAEGSDRLDRGASGCERLCEMWRLCEQHRGLVGKRVNSTVGKRVNSTLGLGLGLGLGSFLLSFSSFDP